jgi:hypothetical protein
VPAGVSLRITERTFTENDDGTLSISPELDLIVAEYDSGILERLTLPIREDERIFVISVNDGPTLLSENDEIAITTFEVLEQPIEDTFFLMPPVDKAYTLECAGADYAERLVDDDDINWWTHRHPGMVLSAARMQYERMVMRNESSAAEMETALLRQIKPIRHKLAVEEMAGPSEQSMIGWVDTAEPVLATDDDDFTETIV